MFTYTPRQNYFINIEKKILYILLTVFSVLSTMFLEAKHADKGVKYAEDAGNLENVQELDDFSDLS